MRPAGNLAGVSFIDAPLYHPRRDEWREIISNSGYFFTVSTMKYFSCRVAWDSLTAYTDEYAFITSEQDSAGAWDGQRRYTVRTWDAQNGVQGKDFGEFDTLREAKRALANRALAGNVREFLAESARHLIEVNKRLTETNN